MPLRAWAVAALSLAGALAPLARASGETHVSSVGGVQVIVSEPDLPSATAGHRKQQTRSLIVASSEHRAEPKDALVPALPGAQTLIRTALSFIGAPYVWGGASPLGFDCSGFTWYAFARIGIAIPRTADVQFAAGRPVPGDPLPGDLVFFQTYDYGASHVGIYLGNGRFVNAIGPNVHVATFNSPYFRGRYIGARRFLPQGA